MRIPIELLDSRCDQFAVWGNRDGANISQLAVDIVRDGQASDKSAVRSPKLDRFIAAPRDDQLAIGRISDGVNRVAMAAAGPDDARTAL